MECLDCDVIRGRIAAREPLLAAEMAHLEACLECVAIARQRDQLEAAFQARPAIDPGPGFEARMVARALARKGARQTVGLAAAVLVAGAIAGVVFAMVSTREARSPRLTRIAASPAVVADRGVGTAAGGSTADGRLAMPQLASAEPEAKNAADPEIAMAARLLAPESALVGRARWGYVEEPLADYELLLEEGMP